MKLRAILCVPLGHHWHTVATPDPFPVLECSRCGRHREVTEQQSFDKRVDLVKKTGL